VGVTEYLEYHRGLLADQTRTAAYRDAIHRVVRPGDIVVDLGAGSGILSFFAVQAGAAHVYAIDSGHMADVAQLLTTHLGFADRITVLHAPSPKVELAGRADVLLTETMGPAGFDEGILGFVLDARRRLLRDDARIVPSRLSLFAAPVMLGPDYSALIEWWSKPRYGFDLSPLRPLAANAMQLAHIATSAHLAPGARIIDAGLARFASDYLQGTARFVCERAGELHGFALWFEATLAPGIVIRNREKRRSHWSQAFLPLEQPIAVKARTSIQLQLETDDGRSWEWQGRAARKTFHQTTRAALPGCDTLE
jgi:hypothetical protein